MCLNLSRCKIISVLIFPNMPDGLRNIHLSSGWGRHMNFVWVQLSWPSLAFTVHFKWDQYVFFMEVLPEAALNQVQMPHNCIKGCKTTFVALRGADCWRLWYARLRSKGYWRLGCFSYILYGLHILVFYEYLEQYVMCNNTSVVTSFLYMH